jgi:aldehyde dehydrogenase (NAD+)
MGAPIGFAQAAQVPAGLGYFMTTLKALGEFQWEERVGKARVVHEPIGVVAMITPWNWPLNQICAKVAPALAAGDTMILKPSEEAPACAAILAEILHEAGVPAGVFNLVNGDGPGVGAALSAHKGVDMVSFTGSTRAGIAIAQAAAPTVKRVHQELGGKAPNLVLEGADLATVLPPTVAGVLANSGQSCIAPTRLLVHTSQVEAATGVIKTMMEATPVGDPMEMGGHIGPVVNKAQFEKIQGLIQTAIDEGATLVTGGVGRPDGRNAGFYVKPTLLADVTPQMRIFREEIFGPVATITSYADRDEGVALANDSDFGLSATISGDPAEAAKVAPRLRAGLVTINSWSPDIAAPFGGYKQSGNGRENGKYGLTDFMEVKTVIGAPA